MINFKKPDEFFARILPKKLVAWHQKKPLYPYLCFGAVCYTAVFYTGMLLPQCPGPSQVAGWFWIGIWLLLVVAASFSVLTWPLKYFGYTYAYLGVILITVTLISINCYHNNPERFLRNEVFKFQKGEVFEVAELSVDDSFNDGLLASGLIKAPPGTIQSLSTYRSLGDAVDRSGNPVLQDAFLVITPRAPGQYEFTWRSMLVDPSK